MSETLKFLLQKTGCETKEELIDFLRRSQSYIAKTVNGDIREMVDDVINANHISPALSIILRICFHDLESSY